MNRKNTSTAAMQMPDRAAGERLFGFVSEDAEGVAGEVEDGPVETDAFWTMVATTEGSEVVVELTIVVEDRVVTGLIRCGVEVARVASPCRYVSLEELEYWQGLGTCCDEVKTGVEAELGSEATPITKFGEYAVSPFASIP